MEEEGGDKGKGNKDIGRYGEPELEAVYHEDSVETVCVDFCKRDGVQPIRSLDAGHDS